MPRSAILTGVSPIEGEKAVYGLKWFFVCMSTVVLALLAGCSEESDIPSCAAGEIYDPLRDTCQLDSTMVDTGAVGEFRCIISENATNLSSEGTADAVVAFDGLKLPFSSVPVCILSTNANGGQELSIQFNTVLDGEGWILALSVFQEDVRVASLAQSSLPYPEGPMPGTFLGVLSRGELNDDGNIFDPPPVARVSGGLLNLTSASTDVGAAVAGTLKIDTFSAFSTDARNGDVCTDNEECQIGEFQLCALEGFESAQVCTVSCLTDNDCNAVGGGGECLLLDNSGICLRGCIEDEDCNPGQLCLSDDEGAYCLPSELLEPSDICESDADCPSGEGCLIGTGACRPLCEAGADCVQGEACIDNFCFERCALLDPMCEPDQACKPTVGVPLPEGICSRHFGVEEGGFCEYQAACAPGLICAADDVCLRLCDTTNPTCEDCRMVEDPLGVCWLGGCEEDSDCAQGEECEVATGECIENDRCADVNCTQPDAICDAGIAVQYSGDGVCDPETGDCDYSAVETREDCDAEQQVCQEGVCVDLCADANCAAPAGSCMGTVATRYTADGICEVTTGECIYQDVVEIDCAERGQSCAQGECLGARPPEPGDLVITEIMYNPAVVRDEQGEWFEVLNTTDTTLLLSGLTISSRGDTGFTLDTMQELPGGAYLLLGRNAVLDENGGVELDIVYPNTLQLGNNGDAITLRYNDTVIDEVDYSDFFSTNGQSLQLGQENDPRVVDNALSEFWCLSYAMFGAGDLGTPGEANTICDLPSVDVTVFALRDDTNPDHPEEGARVRIENLVVTTADLNANYIFAQAPEGGPFSGIAIDISTINVTEIELGASITVEGTYTENLGLASVTFPSLEVTGSAELPPFEVLTPAELLENAEPWESALVRVEQAFVSSANPDGERDFNEFAVSGQDITGNTYNGTDGADLRIDDFFHRIEPDPEGRDFFASIQGVLFYSFENFKIIPRDAQDVVRADVVVVQCPGGLCLPQTFALRVGDVLYVADGLGVRFIQNETVLLQATAQANNDGVYIFFDEPGSYTLTVESLFPIGYPITVVP